MSEEKIKVLYIDDEENNLKGFYASYRRIFDVKTAISAKEARKVLEDDWFHVILADQKMPFETGVEFFAKYRKVNPEPIRILITAQADIKSVISAINDGEIYKYIAKPEPEGFTEFAIKEAYQLYKAREELKFKNIELEKTNRELDKFIYSASHDLRAPLLSILGLTDLGKQDLENSTKYFNMIEKSAQKLDTFILNLINYYKNAKLEVLPKKFNIAKLAKEVFEQVLYFDGANVIEFNVKFENATFYTDKTKLGIIFNNIITNCIRYRDKDKEKSIIELEINCTEDEAVICISDNGIGMSASTRDKIFTMFYKATSKSKGSGIGMYIVKDAVEKLNGTIKIESELGKGSSFTITLPSLG
jgi:signal transduction histidine kinase